MLKPDWEQPLLPTQHLIQCRNSNHIKSVISICTKTLLKHPRDSLQNRHVHKDKMYMYVSLHIKSLPCAVEVVLTLAAASGDGGGVEPEGRPAVPVATTLISIIAVGQQSTSTWAMINISM